MKARILQGDVLDRLRGLDDESVHCVVTSPPYWGLRDYGTGRWEGGDPQCDHRKPANGSDPTKGSTLQGGKKTTGHSQESWGGRCRKCGARRIDDQIGLEESLDEHIAKMVEVFSEVRRVLRADGVMWLNYGDAYAQGGVSLNTAANIEQSAERAKTKDADAFGTYVARMARAANTSSRAGLRPKNLLGLPWRVAFALQADGWFLRSDVIWHKPNPMPESSTDRPTKSHEYVFLMTKSPRYFYDADAIREQAGKKRDMTGTLDGGIDTPTYKPGAKKPGWSTKDVGDSLVNTKSGPSTTHANGANVRTVWTIPTEAMPEAHFATFPQKLAHRCILAGCPKGGVVLDPFSGSGTTAFVAAKNGRDAIGIELNPEYVEISRRRIVGDMFIELEIEADVGTP